MKSVLSVQDLSCVGRCSLTVALPVLSAMGCRCSVLPTAVLSTHTAFPDPYILPLTEQIGPISRHFSQVGVTFDAVTVGYLADPAQAAAVLPVLKEHREKGAAMIVDPAMGDHGRLYRGLSQDHVAAMAEVCREADYLLPNLTEAALLTGAPYREDPDEGWLLALGQTLMARFPKATAAVITGVSGKDGTIGVFGVHRKTGEFSWQTEVVPRQFHGTGDLFAAVFAGGILAGDTVRDSAARAADFVRLCVAGTGEVTPYGVEFERYLCRLCKNTPC